MKQYKNIAIALIAILVLLYVAKYVMKTRESIHNSGTYNKLLEEHPIYTANNRVVEQFFNGAKEYKSNQMPSEIISEDQRQRRMLAIPMGSKSSPLHPSTKV